jgi:2-polyprenyl-6-methoxyphenol hydroxylase-like FAD-dependent oxidoreductase
MEKPYQFRVIIAGGGVAGLTLANALEQAGVDYILLERQEEIAPCYGLSIAAEPNGSRVNINLQQQTKASNAYPRIDS